MKMNLFVRGNLDVGSRSLRRRNNASFIINILKMHFEVKFKQTPDLLKISLICDVL